MKPPEFRPQPAQIPFLTSPADITIYGGSAGGGKSWAILYDPLQYVRTPGFNAVIFRRTCPEITNPGGLWDEAGGLYPYAGGAGYVGALEYRWPEYGTRVSFRHLQHEDDKRDWHGAQICDLGFDELTHFTEGQFWYLLSRNRSTCGVRPYVRATCNPHPGWVRDLLAPWVDDAFDGVRAASGESRWFVRVDGQLRWCAPETPDAKSLSFIRASVFDNAALLAKDPGYVATLKALPPVERARLLDGDWNVRREGLVYADFEACVVESAPDRPPSGGGMDFGFNNPFAAVWGFVDGDDVLWITGCRYQRQTTVPVHAEALPKGPVYWCDPAEPESIAQLRVHGHQAFACVHRPVRGASGETKKPILAGIDMVSERMRTKRLRIVRRECLPLVRELANYHYDPDKRVEEPVKEDDHACDALRYYVTGLDRNRSVRNDPPETDEQIEAREKAEKAEARKAAAELDRLARENPDDPRWWD